jgi:hypothetical protein
MSRAASEGKPREQDGGADGQKYCPATGPKKDGRPQLVAEIFFARQPVQTGEPLLLPFCHAVRKTGSAWPLPVASKLPRAAYR